MLNNYKAYLDGTTLLGVVQVDLPAVQLMTAEIKAAGIGGTIDEPVVGEFQAMSSTINFRKVEKNTFGLLKAGLQHLEFWGAVQTEDENGRFVVKQHKVVLKGKFKNFTPGKFSVGENQDRSLEMEVAYYRELYDGEEHIEIDKRNMIYTVDGEDLLAEVRAAIGM